MSFAWKDFLKKWVHFLLGIFLALTIFTRMAEAASLQEEEGQYSNLHIITLSNQLTIFVREDFSSAILHAEFMSRAGFSSQSAARAGFFPLHTEVFAKQMKNDYKNFFDTVELNYSTNQESSTFSASLPPEELETFFKSISQVLINPSFSDQMISSSYNEMKNQVLENEKSTSALINSAIDSRIFSSAPWKHDTGIYPALFSGHTTSEVRTILFDIEKEFYVPQNCAIFISGNISHEKVYNLALEYFSEWKDLYSRQVKINSLKEKYDSNKNAKTAAEEKSNAGTNEKKEKRFVITDDSFSKDFTQLVVQFTSLSMNQADILSAAFNTSSSTYIEYETEDPLVALRSYDYLTSASVQQSDFSRLILQALLEEPYSFSSEKKPKKLPSSADQVIRFVENAKAAASLSPLSFSQAQNEISSKYKKQTSSPLEGMNFIADFWALHPELSSEVFMTRFEALEEEIKNESAAEIYRKVQEEEPYIFVLLNTENYLKEKESYEELGFNLVTRKNASWYTDQMFLKKALADENLSIKENADEKIDESESEKNKNAAQSFYESNSKMIKSAVLENDIPLLVKENPKSNGLLISICIDGGEAASPANEHYLRTLIVNYLSYNLQAEISKLKKENKFKSLGEIKSSTNNFKSYITISCLKEDLENALSAFVNAVIYGDIFPSTADRIMYEQYGQWNTKISNMDFQMSQAALKNIYQGTSIEKLFDIESPIFKETTFKSLKDSYAQLINAENYSIVILGDITFEEAKTECEKTFNLLKGKGQKKNFKITKGKIKSKTDKISIRHTYNTGMPAEMAGDTVPILVPTTEFKDPAQFWFACPTDDESREIFNALLYELAKRMDEALDGQAETFVTEGSKSLPYACLKTPSILYTANFLSAYKKAVTSLKDDLKTEKDKSDIAKKENSLYESPLLKNIKTRWMLKALLKTQSDEGTAELLQNGLVTGNALLYLEDYLKIENASLEKMIQVAKKYLPDSPTYSIYSKDSK